MVEHALREVPSQTQVRPGELNAEFVHKEVLQLSKRGVRWRCRVVVVASHVRFVVPSQYDACRVTVVGHTLTRLLPQGRERLNSACGVSTSGTVDDGRRYARWRLGLIGPWQTMYIDRWWHGMRNRGRRWGEWDLPPRRRVWAIQGWKQRYGDAREPGSAKEVEILIVAGKTEWIGNHRQPVVVRIPCSFSDGRGRAERESRLGILASCRDAWCGMSHAAAITPSTATHTPSHGKEGAQGGTGL